jgi:uncharacterized protein (DUF2141 family)
MKQNILLFFLVILGLGPLMGQEAALSMRFESLASEEGQMLIALFDSKKDFLDEPVYSFVFSMEELEDGVVALEGVPEGSYAFSIIHDKNKNMELDKRVGGIPREPFGFSNNPKIFFGPPGYEACLVEVKGKTEVMIELKELKF